MRYGWRARIGHIAPAILDTSAEEFRKLLPEGVIHVGLTISEPIQTLGAEQAAAAFDRMVDASVQRPREQWWLQLKTVASLMARRENLSPPARAPTRIARAFRSANRTG